MKVRKSPAAGEALSKELNSTVTNDHLKDSLRVARQAIAARRFRGVQARWSR
jgi:hypothetical protein